MTTYKESADTILLAEDIAGPQQGQWTYGDYAALPDDGRRYEIMNGVLIMAPAPTPEHQDVSLELAHYFRQAVKRAGLGKVLPAPLDVELAPGRVVQPDITVILNAHLSRIQGKRVVGAPDLVVEIASPGTAPYDRLSKYEAYEQVGVAEYWIVDPKKKSVEVFVLEKGRYQSLGSFQGTQTIPSHIAPGIAQVHVEQFFL